MARDADDAVRRDGDEDQRIVHPAIGHAVGAVLGRIGGLRRGREPGREDEAAQRGHALEKAPAAQVGEDDGAIGRDVRPRGAHRVTPDWLAAGLADWLAAGLADWLAATCLIAARIRT